MITEKDIISPINKNLDKRPRSDLLVKSLSELIRSENVYETGWILPDFPRTWKEASKMVHFGILPTHVIQLIPTFSLPLNDLNYKKMPLGWVEYRRELLGMREIFKHSLKVRLRLVVSFIMIYLLVGDLHGGERYNRGYSRVFGVVEC